LRKNAEKKNVLRERQSRGKKKGVKIDRKGNGWRLVSAEFTVGNEEKKRASKEGGAAERRRSSLGGSVTHTKEKTERRPKTF